jgi:hypothetical protein
MVHTNRKRIMKCPISNKDDMMDDCHITIEFGYGSDKDLTTYTFSPVHDEVGKKVLAYIQSISGKGVDIENFARDVMDETFNN